MSTPSPTKHTAAETRRESEMETRSTFGQVQQNPTTQVIPSGWHLLQQINAAEQKCADARRRALNERGERIAAMNARLFRESREHNCRRYVNAGDKP